MSDNTAHLAGYTRAIMVSYLDLDLSLYVTPDCDLDGRFKAYDRDECEWIWVNGWLIENLESDDYEGIDEYARELAKEVG